MLVCVDLDGTIDAYPQEFQALLSALRAAGHRVDILTGSESGNVEAKGAYLASLGCGECYDRLVVMPDDHKHPERIADLKARYCAVNGAAVLVDNAKDNARATADAGVLVLVPWNTRH